MKKQFRPFNEARKFAQSLKLKNGKEWKEYYKSHVLPSGIPRVPHFVYKDKGWQGMGDWLGTGNISPKNREFLPFEKSREFVRSLGLKNREEWIKHTKSGKLPKDIPTNAAQTYKNRGWKSWGDFLGTGFIAPQKRKYLSFKEAREEARKLAKKYGIKTMKEWLKAKNAGKIPGNIPAYPMAVYSKKKLIQKHEPKMALKQIYS